MTLDPAFQVGDYAGPIHSLNISSICLRDRGDPSGLNASIRTPDRVRQSPLRDRLDKMWLCGFCGGHDVNMEHVWPNWLRKVTLASSS